MKIHILVDNNTLIDRYFQGEPGVSYYIEDDDINILFDAGYSDVFINNATKMQLDLYNLDYIVISHGHLDHTWGLLPLIRLQTEAFIEKLVFNKPKFVSHPDALKNKVFEGEDIGSIITNEKIQKHYEMKLTKKPYWLTDNIVFLGEIERKNDFEGKEAIGTYEKNGKMKKDYIKDDSAVVYKSSKGLVIITGCSHAGICNIINYAKKVCDEDRIVDIIGGFHLLNPKQEVLEKTVEYFRTLNTDKVHACHCTDLKSKIELAKVVDVEEVGVGMTLVYD
jgi:7,8-dihydropterin-6-yl-methyl-4-(beta-D-ribofuranosyl)aminobenzene 5'-phosphate synthase